MKRQTDRLPRQGESIQLANMTVTFNRDGVNFAIYTLGGMQETKVSDPIELINLRNHISIWQANRRAEEKKAAHG